MEKEAHHGSPEELELRGRYEDLQRVIEGQIWPPSRPSPARKKLIGALREVLSRLPQDVFDRVDGAVGFALDDPMVGAFAMNVPAPTDLVRREQRVEVMKRGVDTEVA